MPSTSYCACCNKIFKTNLLINCSVCLKLFKHTCVNISLDELKTLKELSEKGIEWTCAGCREFGNELKGLKALILKLQSDMQELKTGKNSTVAPDPLEFEEIVEEVNQRNKRKQNLIVFGLNEQIQRESADVRIERDRNSIINIINILDPEVDTSNLKPIRLGRFQEGKNRPIKFVLDTEESVYRILKKTSVLKTHNDYKNKKIFISPDRTPRQLEFYRNLKKQLEDRKKAGETGLNIKHVKGIPQIVLN